MFGKRRAAPTVRPVIRDRFAVTPVKPENVDVRHDSRGLIHLRLNVPVSRFRKKLAGWIGYDYSRKIELDEFGTLYYSLVDGTHSLSQIVEAIRAKSGGKREEAEQQVILFTRKLMTMGMLYLQVPAEVQRKDKP